MNWKTIGIILSRLLIFIACTMLLPLVIAFYFKEQAFWAFGLSGMITLSSGLVLRLLTSKDGNLAFKEGCTAVTLGWLCASLFGSLPYVFSGVTVSFIDAVFEAMSGFTTTGATIFRNVEVLPQSILFWRSLSHWLGGMGIIVLFIAVLPSVGNTAFQLFKAEVPGPVAEKMKPRIQDTARILWAIYLALTGLEIILLIIFGMPFLEAVNHSLATMATGGFSTKNASVGHFATPAIEYIIATFMILAGVNFSLYYYAFKNGFKNMFKDSELKLYLLIIASTTVFITFNLVNSLELGMKTSFRYSFFQVASVITTTGFASVDFNQWPVFSKFLLFILMFMGSCAGSTAGGITVARIMILLKNSLVELKKILHPKGVYNIRINGLPFPSKISSTVLQFFFIYITVFVVASAYMSSLGLDMLTATSSVAATLGNVGPGFGLVGATGNYADIPGTGKILLTFLMLLGRLELFTVLILFLPEFWGIKFKKRYR